jgi:D-beta-D-heptose 7-phosphate kinase/D-beta-D-heptose 1-phosphate adenosyltransferase
MSLASRLKGRRVVIVGDVMLDRFLIGRVDRISPEAPVPVLRFERETRRLGGAANVAAHVRALGGHPVLVGVIGRDEWGAALTSELDAAGIEHALVVDTSRPTTCKVRLATSRNQQVARIDYENDADVDAVHADALLSSAGNALAGAGAVIVSDYLKGAVSAPLFLALAEQARKAGVPIVADPKAADAAKYRGASVITPNHHEAETMTKGRIRSDADARDAARMIRGLAGAGSVLITRGDHGMWLLDGTQDALHERALPAAAREVSDVTGAGDTVAAALGLAIAGGLSLLDAADLANRAAGIVVGKFGAATASIDEL